MFNALPKFSRAKTLAQGKPDAAGRLEIIYQTCNHTHDSRDAALACEFGGEFLYERRVETFEHLSEADQHRNEEWSEDFANGIVAKAVSSVQPDERLQPGRRVDKRGNRFDVYLVDAEPLCNEYEAAIRKVLGVRFGAFRCE